MITYCESEGDLDGDGEDEMMCSEEPDGNFLQDCLDRLYEAWEACEEFYESMAPEPIPDPIPDSDIDPSTLPVELDET